MRSSGPAGYRSPPRHRAFAGRPSTQTLDWAPWGPAEAASARKVAADAENGVWDPWSGAVGRGGPIRPIQAVESAVGVGKGTRTLALEALAARRPSPDFFAEARRWVGW